MTRTCRFYLFLSVFLSSITLPVFPNHFFFLELPSNLLTTNFLCSNVSSSKLSICDKWHMSSDMSPHEIKSIPVSYRAIGAGSINPPQSSPFLCIQLHLFLFPSTWKSCLPSWISPFCPASKLFMFCQILDFSLKFKAFSDPLSRLTSFLGKN